MDDTKLKFDPSTGIKRSVYSLRYTAICIRITLSHGKANIFNLAKNAARALGRLNARDLNAVALPFRAQSIVRRCIFQRALAPDLTVW